MPDTGERKYQLECEVTKGPRKGERFIMGYEDVLMTHREVIRFRDAHSQDDYRIFHIVER